MHEGDVIGGYRLLRPLGRGGYGEVHLGARADGRRAAVKILLPDGDPSKIAEFRMRFAREVEAARQVPPFCIASVLDADPHAEPPWIATEYIDGPTLQEAVERRGPRAGADLHRLAVSTATALTAIHAMGVVHRDFKPRNIMLAPDGPRVIDFGIARPLSETAAMPSAVIGTPAYMAPEQYDNAVAITPAMDVFAWGAVMVFAATGHLAFPGRSANEVMARVLRNRPDTGGVPDGLLPLVRRCLAPDPSDRPTAHALLSRLLGHGEDDPLSTGTALLRGSSTASATTPGSTVPDEPRTAASPTRSETGPEGLGSGRLPPYRFRGALYTDPGDLAEAMQRHWTEAAQVFATDEERAALRDWIIEDVRDTRVDRSDLRRPPRSPDLAVAWFIARLRPGLPPVYRGADMTLESLGDGGDGPAARVLDAPFGEVVMVLRVMAEHHCAGHTCAPGAPCSRYRDLVAAAEAAGDFTARYQAWFGSLSGLVSEVPSFAPEPASVLAEVLGNERFDLEGAADGLPSAPWRKALLDSVGPGDGPRGTGARVVAAQALEPLARVVEKWKQDRRDSGGDLRALRSARDRLASLHRASVPAAEGRAGIPSGSAGKASKAGTSSRGSSTRPAGGAASPSPAATRGTSQRIPIARSNPGVAFSPRGRRIAVFKGKNVDVFDVSSGRMEIRLRSRGMWMSVEVAEFSPDADRIAVGTFQGGVLLFSVVGGRRLITVPFQHKVNDLAFHPDGFHIAAATGDNRVQVWETGSGNRLLELPFKKQAKAVQYSRDGRFLAAGAADGMLVVCNAQTGAPFLSRMQGKAVNSLAFSPDGRSLLSAGDDRTARIWDLTTGAPRMELPHGESVRSAAFSPDGRHVATLSSKNTYRLWDASTGTMVNQKNFDRFAVNVVLGGDCGLMAVSDSTDLNIVPF